MAAAVPALAAVAALALAVRRAVVPEAVAVLAVAPLVEAVVVPVEAQPEAVLAAELGEAQVVAQGEAQVVELAVELAVVLLALDHTPNNPALMPRSLPAALNNKYIL